MLSTTITYKKSRVIHSETESRKRIYTSANVSRIRYSYRYGFNGKELDPEGIGGGGSTYDYGFRIYNPQIGRFLSVDPLAKSFSWYTPYQFAGNKPIIAIDLDGLEEKQTTCGSTTVYAVYGVITEGPQAVPNSLDIDKLIVDVNNYLNDNPGIVREIGEENPFNDSSPVGFLPSNVSNEDDHYVFEAWPMTTVFRFEISTFNAGTLESYEKGESNDKLYRALDNGQQRGLGGIILMGYPYMFDEKTNARFLQSEQKLFLNPRYFDPLSPDYKGFTYKETIVYNFDGMKTEKTKWISFQKVGETLAVGHEIGHDLGLTHPDKYPDTGIMAGAQSDIKKNRPTKEEIQQIDQNVPEK